MNPSIMKKLTSLFISALFILSSCVEKPVLQAPERISLYEMEEAGSKYYRIPALVKAADGALVAIADKRGDALATFLISSPSFRNEALTAARLGATCLSWLKVTP